MSYSFYGPTGEPSGPSTQQVTWVEFNASRRPYERANCVPGDVLGTPPRTANHVPGAADLGPLPPETHGDIRPSESQVQPWRSGHAQMNAVVVPPPREHPVNVQLCGVPLVVAGIPTSLQWAQPLRSQRSARAVPAGGRTRWAETRWYRCKCSRQEVAEVCLCLQECPGSTRGCR